MKIVNIPIEKLKMYENNPRINEESIKYVANSIKEFGFKVPLVIDKDYNIITGHTRYRASIELGLKELPCIVADDLNEEQVKLFRIVDNKTSEYSRWDYDALDEELDAILLNMEDYGFMANEDSMEFIDGLLQSGDYGESFEPDIETIHIKFFVDEEKMVKDIIRKHGKEKILKKVYQIVGDENA
jgi:hypothetical protein